MARLDRAAESRGKTRNAFLTDLVQAACAEVEEERRLRSRRGRGGGEDGESRRSSEPAGLGIAAAMQARRQGVRGPVDDAPSQAQAPVVINVGGAGAGGAGGPEDAVETLARFVVGGGPAYLQDTRLQQAVDILAASARDEGAARKLAEQLDGAIDRLKGPRGDGDLKKVVKKVRTTFAGLSSLLGGGGKDEK